MDEIICRAQIAIAICYKWIVDDSIKYFAAKENQNLGVVKAKKSLGSKLDLSPWAAPS
ncbi:hypothetical protein [Nostoc sp. FACHB-133]|uniref:hypothetical protein n=1 Tax=Nostoc sp. FACHB-133 TaxID=2692835 RepID=UPI001687B68D|nr:hypothetical protein [Nostoc sp. FACHB-133]MBD2527955.1 hypothetical protein [Nostoc sp. FACHB-133]